MIKVFMEVNSKYLRRLKTLISKLKGFKELRHIMRRSLRKKTATWKESSQEKNKSISVC
jgi:hypothetical protein